MRVGPAGMAAMGLLLLGAGFGLGTLFGTGGGPPPARPSETVVITREVRTTEPAAVPPSAALPAAPAAAAHDLEAARAVLAGMSAAPIPSGTGAIRVRVVTEDGKPVPGVEALLTPEPPPEHFPRRVWRPDEDPDMEVLVADFVRRTRWGREARRTGVTDAAGEVRIEGLTDLSHSALARKKGWQFTARSGGWRVKPGAEIEFVGSPTVEIPIEVLLPDGTSPRTATLRLTTGSDSSGAVWTRESPLARVKPGTWQVSASSGDEEDLRSDAQTVTVSADAAPSPVRLALKGRPGLKGRILVEGAALEGSLRIRLARIPAGGKPDPSLLDDNAQETGAHSAGGFTWSFREVIPGKYLVGVMPFPRGKVLGVEEVEVAGEIVTKDLRLPAMETEDFVLVRVLGPEGTAIPVIGFQAGYRSGGRSRSSGGGYLKRADGAYLVGHVEDEAKPEEEATWWVEAQTPLGSKRAEYRRGPVTEVLLRLEEPGTVEVAVPGHRGSPVEGTLQVSLGILEGAGNRTWFTQKAQQRIDAEGRAVFSGVQPGDFHFSLQGGARNSNRVLVRVPVAVRSGKNAVTLPMPTLYSVSVYGGDGRFHLRRKDDTSWIDNGRADAEGRCTFEGLPEGEWTVQSGGKSQEFRLPGTAEVRL